MDNNQTEYEEVYIAGDSLNGFYVMPMSMKADFNRLSDQIDSLPDVLENEAEYNALMGEFEEKFNRCHKFDLNKLNLYIKK